jgi:putative ABC transport system permease protein
VNLLIGALTIGLIFAPLALGVFITYRLYHTLDLTADGSFGVGAATVAALLVRGVPALMATAIGALAGVAAGAITGVLHTRLSVGASLAGVLTSTALYSAILVIMGGGDLSLASTASLVRVAEQVGRTLFALPDELTVLGTTVSGGSVASLVLMGLVTALLATALTLFLRTDLGLAMRAAGNNPQMARSVAIEVNQMVVLGLGLSNGLIALAGALFAQFSGFANVQMGIGSVIVGLAMLMVGEGLLGKRTVSRGIASAVAGAMIFRLLVAGAIRVGLNPNALKLVTALLVLSVLMLPSLLRQVRPASRSAGSHA